MRCRGAYLVPREDGRYVLGATVEERGFELEPTAGAAYELLRAVHELVPGVSELQLEEVCVGLRPGTPDNAPIIGPGACEGLIWATGHYRNGILLTPLTAELVVAALTGASGDPLLQISDPARFWGRRGIRTPRGGVGVIVLNGTPVESAPDERLSAVLSRLGVSGRTQGVAVAVDGEVVPRSDWRDFELQERARVEVLGAMQGG